MAYKLQLAEATRIYLDFHVSLLKPYYQKDDNVVITPAKELPPFTDVGVVMLEPHKILDMNGLNKE